MIDRYVVIIAGGKGERFWPQSRTETPKHFLPIVGDKPMLTQTIERLDGFVPKENILIITNQEQYQGIFTICPGLKEEQVIAEPMGRDTTAAVMLALALVKQKNPKATFAVLPSDHVIHNKEAFLSDLEKAFFVASNTSTLVTLSIKPTYPSSGYGYVKVAEPLDFGKNTFKVDQFVEKPDVQTAKTYLESGDYFWNGGMFVWSVETLENNFLEHQPELFKIYQELEKLPKGKDERDQFLKEHYPNIEKISIDYAIMEKSHSVATVKALFDWDDVGEWPAIGRHYEPDSRQNVIKGLCQLQDAQNNIIVGSNNHLIALIGVEDLIVVNTPDATLVCSKDKAQDIKKLVKEIVEDPDKRVFF